MVFPLSGLHKINNEQRCLFTIFLPLPISDSPYFNHSGNKSVPGLYVMQIFIYLRVTVSLYVKLLINYICVHANVLFCVLFAISFSYFNADMHMDCVYFYVENVWMREIAFPFSFVNLACSYAGQRALHIWWRN